MMLLLLFGSFFLLLALGVPILFSMGVSAGVYYVVSGYPLMQFVQKTIGGVDSFTLLAIPFFLLAGDIMGKGGISKRMLRFANALVGPLTGGLAVTGVVSSAMFGTICGSAPATATEAAVISVVWSAFLTVVVYREINVKELCTIITDGVGKAGQIIGMMASSAAFGYALTVEKVPALMANFFVQYVDNALVFFLITTSRIVDVDIDKMFPDLLWCIGVYVLVIALVALFPGLATWLPSMMA